MPGKFDLSRAVEAADRRPPLAILYGPAKIGKTTVLCGLPRPFYIGPEQGLKNITPLPRRYPEEPKTLDELYDALADFRQQNWPWDPQTRKRTAEAPRYAHLILDSASWVQDKIHAAARAGSQNNNLDDDYKKGWGLVAKHWDIFASRLQGVLDVSGAVIWLVAHAAQTQVAADDGTTYKKWDLELEPKAAAFWRRTAEHVLFMNAKTFVTKGGRGKRSVGREEGRVIYTRGNADHFAGSRSSAPDEIPATAARLLEALRAPAPAAQAKLTEELDELWSALPEDERAKLADARSEAKDARAIAKLLNEVRAVLAQQPPAEESGDDADEARARAIDAGKE